MERNERGGRGRRGRKKVCSFCVDKVEHIDYKDVAKLRRYLSDRAKIVPRRVTGTCARHHVTLLSFRTSENKSNFLDIRWSGKVFPLHSVFIRNF